MEKVEEKNSVPYIKHKQQQNIMSKKKLLMKTETHLLIRQTSQKITFFSHSLSSLS